MLMIVHRSHLPCRQSESVMRRQQPGRSDLQTLCQICKVALGWQSCNRCEDMRISFRPDSTHSQAGG